ncbi:YuzB family protein [Domibacillus sp. 8LH]|uniref:YuzB family protein n=1 Tax=Domibacillus TaxID=1433999 RepID=UPI001F561D58|nr:MULTISPECIES: YuzB family protein [Domibacillus]MCI2255108.1 YuzB family protein [Domibacillus sp. PGB-M46]MCM3787088.1 YuzB family protein [Domibacillus indicus]WNS81618.1 YuzB family protein [Domibacillus sp. DTU_2020_1001157_1_SI_ALB_TIR_016]
MKPIIEFCVSNLASGSQEAFEKLERDPNLDVIEYGCLSYCTRCSESPFALVNGEVVDGATPDELVSNIYTHIDQTWLF